MDAVFSPEIPANASPPCITGRFLAHNKLSKAERAFLGVDFLSGKKQPVSARAQMPGTALSTSGG
jgi:hypothetical protein